MNKFTKPDLQWASFAYAKGKRMSFVLKNRNGLTHFWVSPAALTQILDSLPHEKVMEFDINSLPEHYKQKMGEEPNE